MTDVFRLKQGIIWHRESAVLKKLLFSLSSLLFWKENGNSYPILQQLAMLFLRMSAGLVQMESMFSICGLVYNSKRSGLCLLKLHKICFLHENLMANSEEATNISSEMFATYTVTPVEL